MVDYQENPLRTMKLNEIFEYSEIKTLQEQLFEKLYEESGRGALLIAKYHTDGFLKKLIESALPSQLTTTQRDRLFVYPGPFILLRAKFRKLLSFS